MFKGYTGIPLTGLSTALMRCCVQGVYRHSPYGSIHSTKEVLCLRGIQAFPLWGSLHSTKEVLCLRGIQASPLQGLSTALTRYHIKGYVGNTSLRGILVST